MSACEGLPYAANAVAAAAATGGGGGAGGGGGGGAPAVPHAAAPRSHSALIRQAEDALAQAEEANRPRIREAELKLANLDKQLATKQQELEDLADEEESAANNRKAVRLGTEITNLKKEIEIQDGRLRGFESSLHDLRMKVETTIAAATMVETNKLKVSVASGQRALVAENEGLVDDLEDAEDANKDLEEVLNGCVAQRHSPTAASARRSSLGPRCRPEVAAGTTAADADDAMAAPDAFADECLSHLRHSHPAQQRRPSPPAPFSIFFAGAPLLRASRPRRRP